MLAAFGTPMYVKVSACSKAVSTLGDTKSLLFPGRDDRDGPDAVLLPEIGRWPRGKGAVDAYRDQIVECRSKAARFSGPHCLTSEITSISALVTMTRTAGADLCSTRRPYRYVLRQPNNIFNREPSWLVHLASSATMPMTRQLADWCRPY